MTDDVAIAGLSVAGLAFGAVSARSEDMEKQPNDGLIGMAFGTIAQSRRPTFFESLIAQRKLPAPLFSVHLSRHEESGSSVCFLSVLLVVASRTHHAGCRCALAVSTRAERPVP